MAMDIISELPEELAEKVFIQLDPRDLTSCMGVCHRWRRIANCDRVWRQVCQPSLRCTLERKSPTSPAVGLDEPCALAKVYFDDMKVLKNWIDDKFKEVTFEMPEDEGTMTGCWIFANERTVVSSFLSGDILVWPIVSTGGSPPPMMRLPSIVPTDAREGISVTHGVLQGCQLGGEASMLLGVSRSNVTALYHIDLCQAEAKLSHIIAWKKQANGRHSQRSLVESIATGEKTFEEMKQFACTHYETQASVEGHLIVGLSQGGRPTLCLLDKWDSTILLWGLDQKSSFLFLNESVDISKTLQGVNDGEICVVDGARRISCYNTDGVCLYTIALDNPSQRLLNAIVLKGANLVVGGIVDNAARNKLKLIGWRAGQKHSEVELNGEDGWWEERVVSGWGRLRTVGHERGVAMCAPSSLEHPFPHVVLWWPLTGTPPTHVTLCDPPQYNRLSLITIDYFDVWNNIFILLSKTGPSVERSLNLYSLKSGKKLASRSKENIFCYIGKTVIIYKSKHSIKALLYTSD